MNAPSTSADLPLPPPPPVLPNGDTPRTVYDLTRALHDRLVKLRDADLIEVRSTFSLYTGRSAFEPARLSRSEMLDALAQAMQQQIHDAVQGGAVI